MATGKTGRLPREICEQVSEQPDAGEPGKRLMVWPRAAFREAFVRYERRNQAKLGAIKVNQGDKFKKVEEVQKEMGSCPADCGDEPSPLRGRWFADSPCAEPAVGREWMNEDLAGFNRIKVNQGKSSHFFYPERERVGAIRIRHGMARHPPPRSPAVHCFHFSVCRNFRNPQICVAVEKC